ncbi:hypothetical protein C9413_11355 [Rhizobium sp. SEMIA 4085]|uniref:Uncharacterized protein n=1 Tax=Rhizobium gallicum bv. gallicum R602sp TaxID=1041138 RepID=A0A0B4X5W2_9HYPH|nr:MULTISPECIES: hypothetical protein [Rhizobium]AJD41907.1 hypothetical protein RGR602_CH02585 [Rhizobium gallicum bv. gallicum R602sp]NNH30075.1 hypothetical protein [Rhizobium sp. SEMIA 4085]
MIRPNDPLVTRSKFAGTICAHWNNCSDRDKALDQPLKESVNAPFFDASGMARGA